MSRIRTLNASITVECALVMPLILSVFTALIAFLLFIYNRNVLRDAAVLGVKTASYHEKLTNREIEEAVMDKCLESLSGRTVCLDSLKLDVSVGKAKVRVHMSGGMNLSAFAVTDFPMPFERMEVEAAADRFRPSQLIRNIRKGEAVIGWLNKKDDESTIQTGYEMQLSDFTKRE